MKQVLSTLLLIIGYTTSPAQQTGMHFEHNTTWEAVLAKAKAENKFIFVDCFTTWCGPCKMMSTGIFPMQAVGDFYNKNFINVKVQLDTTATDSEDVKNWYTIGDMLEAKYSVSAYPTYLFFDSNGNIVDRSVGATDAEHFISKGEEALNPEKQYYGLKHQYENGRRDTSFLLQMAKAATQNVDAPFSKTVVDEYLQTQKDLLTPLNSQFLAANIMDIKSSKDIGFKELLSHPTIFDSLLGPGVALNQTRGIILAEEATPFLLSKTKPANASPDWLGVLKRVSVKYPEQANEAIAYYKIDYYYAKKDWKNFGTSIANYMKLYDSNLNDMQVNNYAWSLFESCNDMACINNALVWSKKLLTSGGQAAFIDTYANLLYKSGKKREAIEWEKKAMNAAKTSKEDIADYEATLLKMSKGQKTW